MFFKDLRCTDLSLLAFCVVSCVVIGMNSTTQPKKARIYPQKHRSGNTTWKVFVGKKEDEKDDLRNFSTEQDALAFAEEWNKNLQDNNAEGFAELNEVTRKEFMLALAKLKRVGAGILEAVDFYIKHARPTAGPMKVSKVIDEFLAAKEKAGKSAKYLLSCRKTYYGPFQKAFPSINAGDITTGMVETYLDKNPNWSPATRKSHITYLATLFNFAIKRGWATLNPTRNIERPKVTNQGAKAISPDSAYALLLRAEADKKWDEIVSMSLVFFCGVRVEETSRLSWAKINLLTKRVVVDWKDSKVGKRRVNDIPENAFQWLQLAKDNGGNPLNNKTFEQRLKRLRRAAKIDYPQNAMRHSFCAYHIAFHKNAALTAQMLGHPNANLLYQTYFECVTEDSAKSYFGMVPSTTIAAKQMQSRKDQEDLIDWLSQ